MPLGFPLTPQHKHRLLFGTVNADKRIDGRLLRKQLADSIERERAELNLTAADVRITMVGRSMLDTATAAKASMDATFCLCPSGDIAGFTARLFFSIVHQCIPVFVALFARKMTFDELAWPFSHSIDWHRAVIFYSLADDRWQHLLRDLHGRDEQEEAVG